MKKKEMRKKLIDSITKEEWEQLEQSTGTLSIGEFNRNVLLHIRDNDCGMEEDIPDERVQRLSVLLRDYLEKYMADRPEGHKWILIACIYLTFIEKIPMHPQDAVKWVERNHEYYCPAHSGAGSVCEYCVCKKYKKDDNTFS